MENKLVNFSVVVTELIEILNRGTVEGRVEKTENGVIIRLSPGKAELRKGEAGEREWGGTIGGGEGEGVRRDGVVMPPKEERVIQKQKLAQQRAVEQAQRNALDELILLHTKTAQNAAKVFRILRSLGLRDEQMRRLIQRTPFVAARAAAFTEKELKAIVDESAKNAARYSGENKWGFHTWWHFVNALSHRPAVRNISTLQERVLLAPSRSAAELIVKSSVQNGAVSQEDGDRVIAEIFGNS